MTTGAEPSAARPTVLHVSPHPDDELAGAPATLMTLRDSGWRVVNLVCSLGSAQEQRERRAEEAREASRRAGFELRLSDAALGRPRMEQRDVEDLVSEVIAAECARLVVSPTPHDVHPAHELVGRAVVAACERCAGDGGSGEVPPRLWLWGLWADLPLPTLAVGFGEKRMKELLHCLEAYAGELGRNDYRRMVRGRAEMNASLGPERVFGFGRPAPSIDGAEFVELLCELLLVGDTWRLGSARWLDASQPLGSEYEPEEAPSDRPIDEWLHAPSAASVFRRQQDADFQGFM